MMRRCNVAKRLILGMMVLGLTTAVSVQAQNIGVQGLVGATKIDEDEITFNDIEGLDDEVANGADLPTLFTVGGAGQQTFWGGNGGTHVGLDYGGLFSFGGDDRDVIAGNGKAIVNVDSSIMLLDLFVGVFASQDIAGRLRIYGACGPLLMLGRITGDFVEREVERETGLNIDESESAAGVGGYARAGVELLGQGGSSFGLGVRAFTSTLDFDDTLGEVEFQGVQGFITYTKRM
jgi:hypothetical protein